MKFDIVTIFPEIIEKYIDTSILKIAQEKKLVEINIYNLRTWAKDKHRTTDDIPFGGGPGMVMKVEPIFNCIKDLKKKGSIVAITTPRGKKLEQNELIKFSKKKNLHMIILCGRYEGFDQRVHDNLVDYEFSIGDYVLSGGELPAVVLIEGITRLIPGVLGNSESLVEESFNNKNLDFPQYTKPAIFNNWKVPDILLSGNHKKISEWRETKGRELTKQKRPDLK